MDLLFQLGCCIVYWSIPTKWILNTVGGITTLPHAWRNWKYYTYISRSVCNVFICVCNVHCLVVIYSIKCIRFFKKIELAVQVYIVVFIDTGGCDAVNKSCVYFKPVVINFSPVVCFCVGLIRIIRLVLLSLITGLEQRLIV